MKAITYTAAREGLASAMDQVCRDRSPIVITRNQDQSVVMMSLDEGRPHICSEAPPTRDDSLPRFSRSSRLVQIEPQLA